MWTSGLSKGIETLCDTLLRCTWPVPVQVLLETQMEMEEENIVNRLQRQLEQLTHSYKALEAKLEQRGLTVAQLGLAPTELPPE